MEVGASDDSHQLGAITESIYNCKTREDLGNLIKFFVIPLAKELGMSTALSNEGQQRMFTEMAAHQGEMESVNQGIDEGANDGLAMGEEPVLHDD
ncbi:hypothetical protein AQUCO_06000062v1 [Aquilegia coerulea]|uniref:Uncharacterized protein n=1 Tax=Aquilegia coerulea TaxID=218851 RepID=A0A2G5CDV1_AQUCA|nr:hypothetical protein AQUCO_06000062v1 [Aquilegia coerulea]